jgi:RimJ/RimL family protein N-acetyltransferase
LHKVGEYTLRKPEPRDVEALYRQKNDPEVAELLGGFSTGYSRADLLKWVEIHGQARDEVLFVIADSQDAPVGHVALYHVDHRVGQAELGILLGERSIWGKGVGRACSRWMVEFGFRELNLRRIYLEVLGTNRRAQELYARLGFVVEGRLRQHQLKGGCHVDVILMGLLREEYAW